MKKGALIVILATVFLWGSHALGQREELSLHPVGGSVYVMTGAGCNVVFRATDEGVLVADSGEKPALADKVIAKIREVSDKPIRYLVFTHYHHIVGAEGFPQSAIVIAHARTRDNIPLYRKTLSELFEKNIGELEEKAARLTSEKNPDLEKVETQINLRKKQLEGIKQQTDVLPQLTFDRSITIFLGGQRVELLYFGPGHTDGDVLVYFPEEKVLYVGDLLYTNGWVPRLDGDAGASVDGWLEILGRVAEMDVDTIVPGHGEAVGKEGFIKISKVFSEYLIDLKAEVKKYIEQGSSLEEMKKNLKLPKYQHMGMAEVLLPYNIEGAYRELKAQEATGTQHLAPFLAETERLDFYHPAQEESSAKKEILMEKMTPVLYVESSEPCLKFCVDALGFDRKTKVPEGNKLGFVILTLGNTEIMLQSYASLDRDIPDLAKEMRGATAVLYIEVKDIREIEGRLKNYDVVVPKRTTFYGAVEVFYRSPGGHVIGFAEQQPN
jgi:cyclase